jgi:hypothetical protein
MTYEDYLATHNLERLPASQIPELLGCDPRELSVHLDHFSLFGREGKPLELHFEIYKSAIKPEYHNNLQEDARKYGLKVAQPDGLEWHNPGRTVKYVITPADAES